MATEVTVPVLGESITEATLGEWLKQPGDPVAADEPVAALETDKVSVEVPSPVAGVMGEQAVKVGDTVQVGAMIATIDAGTGAQAKAEAPQPAVTERPKPADTAGQQAPASGDTPAALSPSVRRAILEHGVDPLSTHSRHDRFADLIALDGEVRVPETEIERDVHAVGVMGPGSPWCAAGACPSRVP